MKPFFYLPLITAFVFTLGQPAYADAKTNPNPSLVTAPTQQANTKTFTNILVGDNTTPVKVTLDTGSSILVLEKQYLANFRADLSGKTVSMGYGNGAKMVSGKVVYTNITLNTQPAITAVNVPVLMVPNGTFQGHAGIMGVEMNNQTSVWRHLPAPYNQMMIINGPASTVSFGSLANNELNQFLSLSLDPARCNNAVQPEPDYANLTCWATRKIPVTYTFKTKDNQVILKAQYHTVFDTGGVLTHFFLQPIPNQLSPYLQNENFNGHVSMEFVSNNLGPLTLPATDAVKVFHSPRNVVNSGFRVFHENTVLFDAKDGVIGFKSS